MLLPTTYPVTCHTEHVGIGSTFVAIKGYSLDGALFIPRAIEKGAKRIVCAADPTLNVPVVDKIEDICQPEVLRAKTVKKNGVEYLYVSNTRKALALLSAEALGNPASSLKIIGVTGTKGKTTTSYLIHHILRTVGYRAALLGSIRNVIIDREMDSSLTTMESDSLHSFFAECLTEGVQYVVMEVSAHALSMYRTYGIKFDGVCFTNLAEEHLDFYEDLDSYFGAKYRLFSQVKEQGLVVINADDCWGRTAAERIAAEKTERTLITGGMDHGDVSFTIDENCRDGLRCTVNSAEVLRLNSSSLFGAFNASNMTMAALLCQGIGISSHLIEEAMTTFPGVAGRLQPHYLKNGAIAFVDFAHNPSSFEAVLKELRTLTDDLIVVFGCGGDRDTTKRPVMGQLAAHFGDTVIITNDNPRDEDPDTIIKQIVDGISPELMSRVIIRADRGDAIKEAVERSKKSSLIALLGKGHEDYYLMSGKKLPFDDYKEISAY